jgi:outer membrane protein assembly factor BamB
MSFTESPALDSRNRKDEKTQAFCNSPDFGRPKRALICPRRMAGATLCLALISAFAATDAQTQSNTINVTTYHNDNTREGANLQETILTTQNVNSSGFGKLFNFPVDGVIDAQPLYLSGVTIGGTTHNVIYAVTENDSVYAIDADSGKQLWQVSALKKSEKAAGDFACAQISPQVGITSTPVIDLTSGPHGTIYVVAMSTKFGGYIQRIHALDVTTGAEEFGGPALIEAKYPGKGAHSRGGFVTFDPKQYAERAGLLLLNHVIYTGWTSHCDYQPYTGWLIGYDESTLAQTAVLNLTPNGGAGSIWQSGAAMAATSSDIFLLDANGTFDTTFNAHGFPANGDFGNAFLRISTLGGGLVVSDYFTMFNTVRDSRNDIDLGSGGALLLPPMKDSGGMIRALAVGAGKDGNIYIVDRNNMGKFNPNNDNAIYQEIDRALKGGDFSMPAYFNGSLYFGPTKGRLLQFAFSQARLSAKPTSRSTIILTYPGATPSVSANGTENGIVWAIEHTSPSVLHAYDAASLATELYNSNQAGSRDQFGSASHFGTPTIANGKVYMGTTNSVAAFGLLER